MEPENKNKDRHAGKELFTLFFGWPIYLFFKLPLRVLIGFAKLFTLTMSWIKNFIMKKVIIFGLNNDLIKPKNGLDTTNKNVRDSGSEL